MDKQKGKSCWEVRTESELEGIEDGPKLPLGTREELGCTLFCMPWYQGARLSADLGRLADRVPQPHLEAARIEAASPAALLWGRPLTDQEASPPYVARHCPLVVKWVKCWPA